MKKPLALVLLSGLFITGLFATSHPAHAAALELYSTPLFNDSSLISYYRLEGDSNDAKGSNNGSDTSVSYGSSYGRFGEGIHFGGSGYTLVGNNLGITGGTITMTGWVKIGTAPASGTYYTLFAQSSATNKIEYTVYYTEVSGVYQVWFCRVRRGTFADCSDVNYTLTPGTWYDVALTYDGTTVTGYVDGVAIGTVSSSGAGSVTPSDVFAIGMDDSSGIPVDFMGNASMDDVAVFSRALSAGEVRDLYNEQWYAQIENTGNGRWLLRSTAATSTTANLLERLPQDWIVSVSSTVSATGTPVIAGGYRWYDVVDATDGVEGWMAASDASDTIEYLPYPTNTDQDGLASIASTVYSSSTDRASLVSGAVDYYYNNSSTTKSLYSSDDGNNELSMFKTGVLGGNTYSTFPEQIILGIAARESGGVGFNNENIHYDYGHGVMQLTPYQVFFHEPSSSASNTENVPANASWLEVFPCRSYDEFNNIGTSTYTNCYTYAGTNDSTDLKSYQHYAGDSSQPEYKWYGNTAQSIYANVKDGMRKLQENYSADIVTPITTSTVIDGNTYSGQEREIILATEAYNGACGYVNDVATNLDQLDTYFPGQTTSTIADIVQKMHDAGQDVVCAQLHSPTTLEIDASSGDRIGLINSGRRNDFPLAVYDPNGKWVKILAAGHQNYIYKVRGVGSGTYGLDITIKHGDQFIRFSAKKMPVLPGQIDTYTIDPSAILKGQSGVTLEVDLKGEGTINRTVHLQGASAGTNDLETPVPQYSVSTVISPPKILFDAEPIQISGPPPLSIPIFPSSPTTTTTSTITTQ